MRKSENKPSYELRRVKRLCSSGDIRVTRRVSEWLRNHGYIRVQAFVKGLISNLSEQDFYKSIKLDTFPGCYGDVYKTSYEENEWYVKFLIEENSTVLVLSSKYDGINA